MSMDELVRFQVDVKLEGVRFQIVQAITDYTGKINKAIEEAVNAACTREALDSVIMQTVNRVVGQVISDEIGEFFRSGKGRKKISDAVWGTLQELEE